jgi:predicted nuclease with RNAse H fold
MSCFGRVTGARTLGIDLAGVTGATGYAMIEVGEGPRLGEAGLVPVKGSPLESEERLLGLIDRLEPERIAIDAPLTLPPCLTCPPYCRGPGENCELQAAREMWKAGSNPVIRRACEVEARRRVAGLDPNPTMGLGIIAARAVSLVRKLEARGEPPCSIVRGEVVEVYPAASLRQLGFTGRPPRGAPHADRHTFYKAVVTELSAEIDGAGDEPQCSGDDDVFDALIAAYTGWLYPDRVAAPPKSFNLATGWIWVPKPS